MNTNTNTSNTYEVGDVVKYSDVCNNMTFVVIGFDPTNPWGRYTLRNIETFSTEKFNMDQCGWKLVAR